MAGLASDRQPVQPCPTGLAACGIAERGSAGRLVAGSEPGSASLEFEPDVAGALVNPPAARYRLHSVESLSADALEVALVNDPLESSPLVDHLDHQAVLVEVPAHRDPAATVHDRVCYQLGDQQLDVVELTFVQLRAEPLG
jgi:hypothetical protein